MYAYAFVVRPIYKTYTVVVNDYKHFLIFHKNAISTFKMFWWSRLFLVEPTAGWCVCRQKNIDNKPWHGMSTSVLDDSPSSTTAARLTLLILSPASSSVTSSTLRMRDNKKRNWLAITTTSIPHHVCREHLQTS